MTSIDSLIGRMRPWAALALLLASALATRPAAAQDWVRTTPHAGDFVLADASGAATLIIDDGDAKVVHIAARDLAADIDSVTGRRPALGSQPARTAVIIGTLGRNALIDRIAASGQLPLKQLHGAWESFVIATVDRPAPGVDRALVIAGSDPRGTAFGAYELAQAIGVSPWNWWSDVRPVRKDALYVAGGQRRFGPPSVKYRGIFINDEDWGMHRWASKTFEKANGGIGPRTYEKVYELLLRLKANALWPAMHPPTKAFNDEPRNAALANDYAIVMGASHAEPMLRNNGKEWKQPPEHFNYATHAPVVQQYWRDRLATNGRYENMYSVGMRGINDTAMQGPQDDAGRIALLQQIFADQRTMLPPGAQQIFTPYKEVLPLYNQGLKVPDDVTIVWPDDNFGYIRRYANDAERRRSGGMGVYYHLSYSGAPLSYLWLYTTPPALVWQEMSKAYDHGARTVWIANVGDIKPSETGMEFFLQMAWDINRWQRHNLPDYLPQWAAREFGAAQSTEIAAIMEQYFRLNYQRKPEHLQWWLPKTDPRPSNLSADDSRQRIAAFAILRERAERVQAAVAPALRDAYFQLVLYPVAATALANQRYFEAELGNMDVAKAANAQLVALTAKWDGELAAGKWAHFMAEEPADGLWKGFRISQWTPELAAQSAAGVRPAPRPAPLFKLEAETYTGRRADAGTTTGANWELIPGLGHSGPGSVALFPTTTPSYAEAALASQAPRLDYDVVFDAPGTYRLEVQLLPTHALATGGDLRFAVALDDATPRIVAAPAKDGGPEWQQNVLNAKRVAGFTLDVAKAGKHTLRIYAVDAGVVLDTIEVFSAATPATSVAAAP